VQIKLNLEMAATDEMIALATATRPQMATLVPEGRQEITTEGGLDVASQRGRLAEVVDRLQGAGLFVSAFIDAEPDQIAAAAACGFDACEVHTGPYAEAFHGGGRDAERPAARMQLQRVALAGDLIVTAGMRFNAGHALTYANVQPVAALLGVRELHIGHSIVSRAVFSGLQQAVAEMKRLLVEAAARVEVQQSHFGEMS
jgi:pyridoxine 5-phosphate synthase